MDRACIERRGFLMAAAATSAVAAGGARAQTGPGSVAEYEVTAGDSAKDIEARRCAPAPLSKLPFPVGTAARPEPVG